MITQQPDIRNITIDPWDEELFDKEKITVHVLRLDKIHPVISGNKWFKLQPYLKKAQLEKRELIITFGGAWSNHLVATAAAAKEAGLNAFGIVRGEKPEKLSISLQDAQESGMQLFFMNRTDYRNKKIPPFLQSLIENNKALVIPEGGYSEEGIKGAALIASCIPPNNYTDICCAVGTGTMLMGLYSAPDLSAQITGIHVLKNNFSAEAELARIFGIQNRKKLPVIQYHYHFGGYAKYSTELLAFMNRLYSKTGIPSDFVYTAKLFYAVYKLASAHYFASASKILLIHSGGLQGNRSLKKGTLIY